MAETHEVRLLFLKEFTKELILNSMSLVAEKKEDEDLQSTSPNYTPSRLYLPPLRKRVVPKKISGFRIKTPVFPQAKIQAISPPSLNIPSRQKVVELSDSVLKSSEMLNAAEPPYTSQYKMKPSITNTLPLQTVLGQDINLIPESELKSEKIPEGFDLGKLNKIVNDPKVVMIECPGPGRNVIAKVLNQVTATKIILTPEEISKVIQTFSEKSRIPIIGGLFKAAVGNLILTAVTSEIIGSRFVITKINPFNFS